MKIKEITRTTWVCLKVSFLATIIIAIPLLVGLGIPELIYHFVDSEIIVVLSQGFFAIFGSILGITLGVVFLDKLGY